MQLFIIVPGLTIEDHDDGFAPKECVFESDAAALKSFIRELVTQSIIPFMESRVVTWNDQVASKRRGIGGKLMSLSKRWTVFGSSKGSNSTTAGGTSSPNSNFDSARGFYPPESPEAIMRQLADYAFMLRDFKLAFSTYDTLRTDFSNDKAWLYHASASELTCVSYLLIPQTLSNRSRSEMVDHKLDAALYSYLGRSSMPTGAVRAIIMTAELLIGRGPAAAEDAAKWAIRSLDLSILSPLPQALLTERIADFYGLQVGSGRLGLGSRRRQTVLWNTLASAVWVKLDQPAQARRRLRQARTGMSEISDGVVGVPFPAMHPLDADIEQGAAGRKDEDLIELDPAVMGNHDNGDIYQMDKRLGKQATLGEPQTADTSGFFTIEANHPGFETAS